MNNIFDYVFRNALDQKQSEYGYSDSQMTAYIQGLIDASEESKVALADKTSILRDTVSQLVEAKRLLQLAMDELEPIGQCGGYSYRPCEGCPYHSDDSMCNPHWNHYEEAMKMEDKNNA